MAYYFMVEKKKGEYQPLNIDKPLNLHEEKKYSKPCAYTLQEIDMFTMMFKDEEHLRKFLVSNGILKPELLHKSLSLRWISKGKYQKVPYDFLYEKDFELIDDPSNLVKSIMKRYYNNDFVFIKKLANYFSRYYECSSTAPEVRMHAEISIREGIRSRHLDALDQNGDNQVKRLVKLLLLEHYEQADGYIIYKNKVNYRNLHTMIAFINNYDKLHLPIETINNKSCLNQPAKPQVEEAIHKSKTYQEKIVTEPSDIKQKTRKRTKKPDSFPGQLTLFDMFNENNQ